MRLTYASLFAGIEAFSVAASRVRDVEWEAVFFSEIEKFPCEVLARRFPGVPNLGDIAQIRADREKGTITNGDTTVAFPAGGIDILAGGSPCQDVSVAGRRAGMRADSGTRSSLAFEYARLVGEIRPRVLLWENVPGVLTSNQGRDFAAFLHTLVELGYCLAWRVLDAQYARVDGYPRAIPQRRKRVWLVGCARAAESVPPQILFEAQGNRGDAPPERQAGKGFATPAGYRPARDAGVVGGGGPVVASTLCAADGKGKNGMDIAGKCAVIPDSASFDGGAAPTMQRRMGTGGNQVPLVEIGDVGVSFDGRKNMPIIKECAHTETIGTNPGYKSGVATCHIVRRLTPTECERLQGFPDGWTRIPWRGKPEEECPDSPRYRALGNSWATNCAEWVLRRIVAAIRLGMA